jgi:hypothetical protein
MHPRHNSSGYSCVHLRPAGNFYAEIRTASHRITLGTFETVGEVARVNDAVAWQLGHPCRDMNFHDVNSAAQAYGAPASHL